MDTEARVDDKYLGTSLWRKIGSTVVIVLTERL